MRVDVAIIGAGFSGTTLAVQLLRQVKHDLSVALIDREDRMARGVAYGTRQKDQLLNVPAGKMSALADDPGHFTDWLAESLRLTGVEHAFLPRHLYGEYLVDTLATATRQGRGATLRQVAGVASSLALDGDGVRVEFLQAHSGATKTISASLVVVATGNYPPPDPPEMEVLRPHRRYAGYPWALDALEGIGPTDSVLILGSGLTAVDQIFTLKNRGFRGSIHIVSGRGLLPRSHEPSIAWECDWEKIERRSVSGLMREVRQQIDLASRKGIGWRAVIDSLRRSSQRIWRALPLEEKRRFLRHVRPYWDVHRHRVSPEVSGALTEVLRENRLTVWAGRCLAVISNEDCVEVVLRLRGHADRKSIKVHKIINCTGPGTVRRSAADPLIESILRAGIGRPDAIGMGLDTTACGALIDSRGEPNGRVFGIGPMRKGNLWETTAVPEIRVQSLDLATHLLALVAEHKEISA